MHADAPAEREENTKPRRESASICVVDLAFTNTTKTKKRGPASALRVIHACFCISYVWSSRTTLSPRATLRYKEAEPSRNAPLELLKVAMGHAEHTEELEAPAASEQSTAAVTRTVARRVVRMVWSSGLG